MTMTTPRLRHAEALWLAPPLAMLLPHLATLPVWLSAACLALWGARLGLALSGRALPARLWRAVLAVAATGAVWLQFGTLFGQRAGVPLFILLLFVKLLESASLAERRLLLILTQFMGMSYFLSAQSLPVTLYLLAVSVGTVAAMAYMERLAEQEAHAGDARVWPDPRASLQLAAGLFAAGLPFALLLFLLFPRLDGPLWQWPHDTQAARTGLTDRLQPGDIANLIQSPEIAFRARFVGAQPNVNTLYWRGPVLSAFDGRAWTAMVLKPAAQPGWRSVGEALDLQLTLEPHQQQWLFSPGLPQPLPEGTALAAGMQWHAREPVRQRKRYDAHVYPGYVLYATGAELAAARHVPEGVNPQARALALQWRARFPDDRALAAAGLTHFSAGFTYTLHPPRLGVHSVDDFLFGARRGFCEHFATSYVFLMRAAGIPARVVTGYQGGEINPLDGHVVVRQSDAHAWAEVWLPDARGEARWVRVDPTASVSPSRIERGLEGALPAAELPPALVRLSLPWLQDMRHGWEALNNGWNQWVLGYGQSQQLALLAAFLPDWANLRGLAALSIAAGLLGGILLAVALWRMSPREPIEPAVRLWQRVLRKLARLGYPILPGEAPAGYIDRVSAGQPAWRELLQRTLEVYLVLRYGAEKSAKTEDAATLQALQDAVRQFESHPSTRRH